MVKIKRSNNRVKKLSQNSTGVSLAVNALNSAGITAPRKGSKQGARPRIKPRNVKGKTYYYYCRGADKEIYLGDAEAILKAVKGEVIG